MVDSRSGHCIVELHPLTKVADIKYNHGVELRLSPIRDQDAVVTWVRACITCTAIILIQVDLQYPICEGPHLVMDARSQHNPRAVQ